MGIVPFDIRLELNAALPSPIDRVSELWLNRPRQVGDVECDPELWVKPPEPAKEPQMVVKRKRRKRK